MLTYLVFLIIFSSFETGSYSYNSYSRCAQPRLANGRMRIRQSGQMVRFSCFPRFQLVGNKYATCRNGHWDAPMPVCVRPGCSVPYVENALAMNTNNDSWVLYFCMPHHRLVGSAVIYCDGVHWNATAPTCVPNSAPPPTSCDFETNDLCGWKQDSLHDFDWKHWSGKTPSSFLQTGPSFDHTYETTKNGYYMYIETTSKEQNDTARLISPVYDATLSVNGCFRIFYHMYGRTVGGLRVYQKPDSLELQTLVNSTEDEKKKYLLLDLWGNQGNSWFGSVSNLTRLNEGFQIVIEGIRGLSYTSDIAIDDVSILQGDNCTLARRSVVTPPNFYPDTCEGRCNLYSNDPVPSGECACSISCYNDENCCTDFFDLCLFEESPSDTESPQTQKLVGSTTELTHAAAKSTTVTTIKTTSTTQRTTEKTTSKPPTTVKGTTKNVARTTTKPIKPAAAAKAPRRTTGASSTRKTFLPTTTASTTKSFKWPTHFVNGTVKTTRLWFNATLKPKLKSNKDDVGVVKSKVVSSEQITSDKRSSRGLTIAIVILVTAFCAAGVWVAVGFRGARGRELLARLRGHVSNDPEVRFLTSDSNY